jgi:DNA polymerase III sliding clamp (beta) subunit (PCNA family)
MTTATLTNQKVTLSAATLYDLLSGAAVTADSGKNALSQLGAVYIMAEDNKLTAAATDRYRLAAGTVELDEGILSASCLTLHDVKRILAMLKPYIKIRGNTAKIEKDGYTLTFSIGNDSSIVANSLDHGFLPYTNMISDEFAPLPSVSLNLSLLASFDKIPHDSTQAVTFGFTHASKAVQIRLAHDSIKWQALLMPMRTK